MNFLRTYQPDKIYTVKELFENMHNLELHKLIPLKNKLKYDTDMTDDEVSKLNQDIFALQTIYNRLSYSLNERLSQPFFYL